MIRHLLKLVWNRKRTNALIVAEIFISLLVIFAVFAGAVNFASNWRRPLGFDYHDVWNIRADIEHESEPEKNPHVHEEMMRVLHEAQSFPEVVAAAGSNTPPYGFSTDSNGTDMSGKYIDLIMDDVTDDFARTVQLHLLRGRFFSAEDDAAQYRPALVDENTARSLYGTLDVLGRKVTWKDTPEDTLRIVGVVSGYRKAGETTDPVNMVFRRVAPDHKFGGLVRNILVRVRPGTSAEFEETLLNRMQAAAPDMSFRLQHMDRMRRDTLRFYLAPVVLLGVIALFLISMVTLGLTGVLWQNVTRRTREIGLRRATGATGGRVHRQILGEVLLLASIACAIGVIVILQLPILGAFRVVSPAAFTTGLIGALAAIYALTLLCGLYPSWLASRLQPADALRYE
jgi:putative ABC transport system permease protein